MKKKYIILFLLTFIVLGLFFYKFSDKKNMTLLLVKKGDVLEAIYGLGKVQARYSYEVKIGVMTNVERIFVKEGQKVKKGSKLISFTGTSLFKAPFDGTVTLVELKDGEIALPQLPILRLENLEDKYIEVSVEQDAALKVRPGQKAKIIFENIKNLKLTGEVKSIYPKKGEFIAHIESDQMPPNILPGMTADVVIEVGKRKNVLLIPVSAISEGRVVRFRSNKKKIIEVEIGKSDGIWAELLKGDLVQTDELIVKGKK